MEIKAQVEITGETRKKCGCVGYWMSYDCAKEQMIR